VLYHEVLYRRLGPRHLLEVELRSNTSLKEIPYLLFQSGLVYTPILQRIGTWSPAEDCGRVTAYSEIAPIWGRGRLATTHSEPESRQTVRSPPFGTSQNAVFRPSGLLPVYP